MKVSIIQEKYCLIVGSSVFDRDFNKNSYTFDFIRLSSNLPKDRIDLFKAILYVDGYRQLL